MTVPEWSPRRRIAVGVVVAALVAFACAVPTIFGLNRESNPVGVTSGPGPVALTPPSGVLFRPEQYGAKGDGRTDDSAAVQKAIDAAAGHGTVWLSARTYLCDTPLTVPSDSTVAGASAAAVLRFDHVVQSRSADGGPYIANSDTKQAGNDHITLRNFAILGGGDGQPAGQSKDHADGLASAIRFYLVRDVTFSNLQIRNAPGDAMNLWAIDGATITNNDIGNSGRGGVVVHWSNSGPNQAIAIVHNRIDHLGDDAIAIGGTDKNIQNESGVLPSNIVISDNQLASWPTDPNGKLQGRGIALLGVTDASVEGNTITDMPESAILLRGSDIPGQKNPKTGEVYVSERVSITGNTITRVGESSVNSLGRTRDLWATDGVEIESGRSVVVTGNTISAVTGTPVTSATCTDCTLAPNHT